MGSVPRLLVLMALMALAACSARPTGDFGRAAYSPINDEVMPAIGKARASRTEGEPFSSFNQTDQEREMHDRVWRYLVAPHAYDWFGDVSVEFQRTRIVPISTAPLRTDRYYSWLRFQRFESSRVRYARVEQDVLADIAMMPAAFASICAVQEVDRQRGIAAANVASLSDADRASAAARRAENRATIDWFVRAVVNRYDSFDYALDHLLVETPHEQALGLNAALNTLGLHVQAAKAGDFCTDPRRRGGAGKQVIASRYSKPMVAGEGGYRK